MKRLVIIPIMGILASIAVLFGTSVSAYASSYLCEVNGAHYCLGGSAQNGDPVLETTGRLFTIQQNGNQYRDRNGNIYNEYTIQANTGQCVAVTNDGEAAVYRNCTNVYAVMYKIQTPGFGFYEGNAFASDSQNGTDEVLCGVRVQNSEYLYEPQPFPNCYELVAESG